jgi:hypothetical protein
MSGRSSLQWDPNWWLYKPLEGIFPVVAAKGPRHSYRRGVGGIINARGLPTIRIVVTPAGLTVLFTSLLPLFKLSQVIRVVAISMLNKGRFAC